MQNNKLKDLRLKRNLTQQEIASKVNLSLITYQRYEKGVRKPNVYIAQKIANALKIDVNEIFPLTKTSLTEQNTKIKLKGGG